MASNSKESKKNKPKKGARRVFQLRINLMYVFLAIWLGVALHSLWQQGVRKEIPYSEFHKSLKEGKVSNLTVTDEFIRGTLKEGPDGKAIEFFTTRVDPKIVDELASSNVEFRGVIESTLFKDLISWVVPVLVFFGVWMFLMRRTSDRGGLGGGFMGVGKSKARVYVEEKIKNTFADVAGVDEAKEELQEIIQFLKDPARYSRLGGRLPKGILLVGPPGTGKTLLARAVAGEAGVPFFFISGSEFVEMFVGVGAARVRDLFEQAQKKAPCIIFIDELDALGRARGISPIAGGGHDEKEQTLNQLLVEMDGFDPRQGVVLLAATNRPEILDPALLRAGRFDRQVLVDRPDKRSRQQILDVHMKKITKDVSVDSEKVASLTPGFTGADLANLVNEAALLATRRSGEKVTMDDFNHAIERIVAGLEKKNRILNPKERKVVAYHEMGHALLALALPNTDPVHKVSIIPRGIGALGYTMNRPLEDRYLMSAEELRDKMVVLLGGRAAEAIVFDEISTGAANDLSRATDIARDMITRYGMGGKELGLVAYESEPRSLLGGGYDPYMQRRYSEETARDIDHAVRNMVEAAYERAKEILSRERRALEEGAQLLLEKETLNATELPKLSADYNAEKLRVQK